MEGGRLVRSKRMIMMRRSGGVIPPSPSPGVQLRQRLAQVMATWSLTIKNAHKKEANIIIKPSSTGADLLHEIAAQRGWTVSGLTRKPEALGSYRHAVITLNTKMASKRSLVPTTEHLEVLRLTGFSDHAPTRLQEESAQ